MGAKRAQIAMLSLLLAPLLGTMQAGPAKAAEIKCTVKTYACPDSRTGEMRFCMTTVCITDKGDIVSTSTIVLKDDDKAGGTKVPKGKAALGDFNFTKQTDKASPK